MPTPTSIELGMRPVEGAPEESAKRIARLAIAIERDPSEYSYAIRNLISHVMSPHVATDLEGGLDNRVELADPAALLHEHFSESDDEFTEYPEHSMIPRPRTSPEDNPDLARMRNIELHIGATLRASKALPALR